MDRKTGRPIISLKFKATPPSPGEPTAERSAEPARKPQLSGREPVFTPKIPSRKHGVREVVVAKPAPPPAPPAPEAPDESKSVPIPPAAFKAATRAATRAVHSVLADPAWQSAELQRSYQEAKLNALPIHRKQAKLISGIVLKRVVPDSVEEDTRGLAMRAAYAAAFASLLATRETADS
jgi:hypothetical protein